MLIDFVKMNGCGNDFVIIDRRTQYFTLGLEQILKLSDYKKSIGFDQLVLVEHSKIADLKITFFNQDGTKAAVCGNATRCIARLFCSEINKSQLTLEIGDRIIAAWVAGDLFSVNMGKADILKQLDFEFFKGTLVNIGNFHLVTILKEKNPNINLLGPLVQNHALLKQATNINFVELLNSNKINLQTFEAGVGETLSCGSGACASFYALYKQNLVSDNIVVIQKGGALAISLNSANEIIMTGSADINYFGKVELLN